MCKRCVVSRKTWTRQDPIRCAFDDEGIFTSDNYCCETLLALRRISEREDRAVFNEDQWISMFPIGERGEFLVLSWYKSRGKTEGIWVIKAGAMKPATLAIVEAYIDSL